MPENWFWIGVGVIVLGFLVVLAVIGLVGAWNRAQESRWRHIERITEIELRYAIETRPAELPPPHTDTTVDLTPKQTGERWLSAADPGDLRNIALDVYWRAKAGQSYSVRTLASEGIWLVGPNHQASIGRMSDAEARLALKRLGEMGILVGRGGTDAGMLGVDSADDLLKLFARNWDKRGTPHRKETE